MFLVSWPGGSWEATAKYVAIIAIVYWLAISVTVIFWTYRDIRQRSRDPILQAVAVLLVLIFNLPGHWLYLIVRPRYTLSELYERSLEEEALLQDLEDQKACPTCKRRVLDEYLICPSCRTQLKEPCRSCAKPLSYAWVACPFCGLEKPPREGYGPRPARPLPRPGSEPLPQNRPAPAGPRAVQQPQPIPQTQTITRPTPQRDPFGARQKPRAAGEDAPVIGE